MSVTFMVVYSSKFWIPTIYYDPVTELPAAMHWMESSAPYTVVPTFGISPGSVLGWQEQYYDCQGAVPGQGNYVQELVRSNFTVTMGDGSVFQFPNEDMIQQSGKDTCPDMTAVIQTTGYSDSGVMKLDTSQQTYVVYYKDGTRETFPAGFTGNIEDTNGNLIDEQNGEDTLGRTFTSGNGTLTVHNSDGEAEDYSFSGSSSSSTTTTQFPTTSCDTAPIDQGSFEGRSTSLALPNGHSFTFSYDPVFGEITRVGLPTGGYIQYTYQTFAGMDNAPPNSEWSCNVDSRRVIERDVSPDGTTVYKWTYDYQYASGVETTRVTDPDLNVTVHTFGTSDAMHETQTQFYDSGSKLWKTISNTWASDNAPVQTAQNGFTLLGRVNWRITDSKTTLNDTGEVSDTQTDYDSYTYTFHPCCYYTISSFNASPMDPIQVRQYDYGVGSPGSLLRRTAYTYKQDTDLNYLDAHIWDRVASKVIYDNANPTCQGASGPCAQTTYSYDTTVLQPPTSTPTQHDTAYNTTSVPPYRGNLTEVSRWRSTDGAWLNTLNYYDEAGNLVKTTDPKNNSTNFKYDDAWANSACAPSSNNALAFPTQVTDALGHIVRHTYYSCSSLLASATDPNGQTTNFQYSDPFDRPTYTGYPDGGSISYTYADSSNQVDTSRPMGNGEGTLTHEYTYDGLERVTKACLTSDPDPAGADCVDYVYDAFNRVTSVSNPHRSSASPTDGTTTYTYDPFGRIKTVTHPDGSQILTTYTGAASEITDEGNGTSQVQRVSQTDGLGRLISVCEVSSASLPGSGGTPGNCGQDIPATGFKTTYKNDELNNLIQVGQSGLNRTFTYDSLSELMAATNPESGETTYTYDANGNVATKTDARGVITTYSYDALNRLTSKVYSGGTIGSDTPPAYFVYDGCPTGGCPSGVSPAYPVGRLVESYNSKAQAWNSYDPRGRVKEQWQCVPLNCGSGFYALPYGYDLVGDLISAGNGAGVAFTHDYNSAAQLTSLTSSRNDTNHPGTLLSVLHHNPLGLDTSDTLGNKIKDAYSYTPRGWLSSISATGAATYGTASLALAGSEQSTQTGGAPGSVTVQFSGSEQSMPGTGTQGSGSITFSGSEQSKTIPGTPGSVSITFSGSEQSKTVPNTKATGSVTISGSERTTLVFYPCGDGKGKCQYTVADSGTVSVTVNGVTSSTSYGANDTSSSVAANLASAVNNNSSSPVTAVASGSTVNLTTKQAGAATNYTLSASSQTQNANFTGTSFPVSTSGTNLTGGTDKTIYDSGTVTVTVNGYAYSGYNYVQGATTGGIANGLYNIIGTGCSGPVKASYSGSTLTLTACQPGSGTNYPFSVSITHDSTDFSSQSFSASLASGNLSGGKDAKTIYDSGTVTLTVNGNSYSEPYNQNSTASSIASGLASAINADGSASVTAAPSGGVLTLTAKTGGSATDYPFSVVITYDSADFSSPSFTASSTSGNLSGGTDNTLYDTGTVTVVVNNYSYPAYHYGQNTTAPSQIATGLQSIIGTDCLSEPGPVVAQASGTSLTLTSCNDGTASDYQFSIPITHDSRFTSPSFTVSPSSGNLTGGQDSTTTYDTGTVSVTVNPGGANTITASSPYSQGSTLDGIATDLVSQLNSSTLVSAGYVTNSDGTITITLTSKTLGTTGNYSFTSSASGSFSPPSFSISPTSSALSGGAEAGTSSAPAYTTDISYAPDGDVIADKDSVNGNWAYTYDGFNRLATSSCAEWTPPSATAPVTCPGAQSALAYSYDYDRFGNRWHQTATQGAGVNSTATFNSVIENNHVEGYGYDAAGNVTSDNNNNAYTYDAENRLTQFQGGGGTSATYVYNASGQRVQKTTGSSTVYYLYDLAGHVISELNSSGGWNRGEIYAGGKHVATYVNSTTYFDHTDWLGTERARTDVAGALSETCQGLPFGDDANCTGGGVSPLYFTGKQRDTESGLDYFGARYYGSSLGRFMSPDPLGGHLADPLTLDKYVYVRDNPVTLTDPSGLDFYLSCTQDKTNASTCQQVSNGGHKYWVQGTTKNGKFNATVVTSASLQNSHSGNTAAVNGNGLEITTKGGTSQGIFISGTPAANGIRGSGGFQPFTFDINGNCGGTCLSSGAFHFNGTAAQAMAALSAAGGWQYFDTDLLFDSTTLHAGTLQYRFGSPVLGGPSPHFSIPVNGINGSGKPTLLTGPIDPREAVPIQGGFHVDANTFPSHLLCVSLGVACQ